MALSSTQEPALLINQDSINSDFSLSFTSNCTSVTGDKIYLNFSDFIKNSPSAFSLYKRSTSVLFFNVEYSGDNKEYTTIYTGSEIDTFKTNVEFTKSSFSSVNSCDSIDIPKINKLYLRNNVYENNFFTHKNVSNCAVADASNTNEKVESIPENNFLWDH